MKKFNLILNTIIILIILSASCYGQSIRLFAGKYTKEGEKGFYQFDLNREDGTFKLINETDAGPNPSYFCISKKKGLIYAANEVINFNGRQSGSVTTLKYNSKSGNIEKLGSLAAPYGGPCFISLSKSENYLFMANYSSGSVTVIKLDKKGIPVAVSDSIIFGQENGKKSHAHMIAPGPSGKRIYLTDLGLDRIMVYSFDEVSGKLKLTPNGIVKLAEGSGPRHFVFNPNGTRMYVISELNSTVTVLNVDANGDLKLSQTLSTLREGFTGKSFCADVHISKNEDFLYGSNRGENTIVTYKIAKDGTLTLAGHFDCGGAWPRNFVIDPSGKYILVACERSGNIAMFRLDEKTGMPVGPAKEVKISSPVCLKF